MVLKGGTVLPIEPIYYPSIPRKMLLKLRLQRLQRLKNAKGPEVHAYHKHPVLLLPSGPDKI